MNSKKPDLALFTKVAMQCGGIINDIAVRFKVTRKTVGHWRDSDQRYRAALDDAQEATLDLCESNLRKLIAGVPAIEVNEKGEKVFAGWITEPNLTSIIFYLKTKGRNRGYVERFEVDNGDAIQPRTLSKKEAAELLNSLKQKVK